MIPCSTELPEPFQFPTTLADWCHLAWQNSKNHGFHDVEGDGTPERKPERQALLHSEVSELFQAFRTDPNAPCDKPGLHLSAAAEELADIVLRLFDFIIEFRVDPDELFQNTTFANLRYAVDNSDPRSTTLGEEICLMHKWIGRLRYLNPSEACARLFMSCARFAAHHRYDLELAVQTKHAYNVKRPHMHGKRF